MPTIQTIRTAATILVSVAPSFLLTPLNHLAMAVSEPLGYRLAVAFQSWWGGYVERLWRTPITVTGREHLPPGDKGVLIAANHKSFADIPLLQGVLGGPSFLLREEIGRIPFIGWQARLTGVSFNREEKDDRTRVVGRVIDKVRAHTTIVVFPEGTRNTGPSLGKLYPGMLFGAYEAGIPVIPVAHYGTQEMMPRDNSRLVTGKRFEVAIGAPLEPRDHDSREAFFEAFSAALTALHDEVVARYSSAP